MSLFLLLFLVQDLYYNYGSSSYLAEILHGNVSKILQVSCTESCKTFIKMFNKFLQVSCTELCKIILNLACKITMQDKAFYLQDMCKICLWDLARRAQKWPNSVHVLQESARNARYVQENVQEFNYLTLFYVQVSCTFRLHGKGVYIGPWYLRVCGGACGVTVYHVWQLFLLCSVAMKYLKKHASHGMNLKVVWMIVVSLKINLVS